MPDRPIAVELADLEVTYAGGVRALLGVSLRVPIGEHVTLLGHSGSGKTTMLSCIAGQVTPTKGRVHADSRIALVYQDLRLVKQLSALQNVLHGAMGRLGSWRTLMRFPANERERAARLLHRVGLGHRVHHRVGRLSGGEQQRVAIARALMQDPRVILADEPVASLDMRNARAIMGLLGDVCREHNITLISVLHDCALAHEFADRIIGVVDGRIVHDSERDRSTRWDPCHHDAQLTVRGQHYVDPAPHPRTASSAGRPAVSTPATPEPDATPVPRKMERPTLLGVPGLEPDIDDAAGPWKRAVLFGVVMVSILAVYAWAFLGIDIGERQFMGMGMGLRRFFADLWPRSWEQVWSIAWSDLWAALIETVRMSIVATTISVLISWPLAAIGARNVGPMWLRMPVRQFLNVVRTVPSLIWALFFVAAVGFGSLAGVAALIAYSIGYLSKFFYEGFEAVDPGPPDALRQIGASGSQRFLQSIWPAARAGVLSSSIFMLEYNVRAASVLGLVGAGGIGANLKEYMDWRQFPDALACLLMLLAVVVVLDLISTRIRAKLVEA